MGRTCGIHGREQLCKQGFCGKYEGKGPLERPRKDNINIYGKEIG